MKRILLATTLLAALVGGGIVAAQTPGTKPDEHAAHHPDKAVGAPTGTPQANEPCGMMGHGMAGGGMMGGGMCPMMGGGMMGMMGGGMCPMMGGAKAKVDVKKIDKGVTITVTSSDAAAVARLQKMAEAMRLMHEAMTQ
jgi:hypothetical protein